MRRRILSIYGILFLSPFILDHANLNSIKGNLNPCQMDFVIRVYLIYSIAEYNYSLCDNYVDYQSKRCFRT